METSSLLVAFEQADASERRALLRKNQPATGFAERFFFRVATLLGENPAEARKLAEGWSIVDQLGDDRSYAWRTKGALERINGNWEASAKSFIRAGSFATTAVHQFSFQTGAVDSLARVGKTDAAVRLGRTIATNLESIGELALAGRAWLNTGNAYNWADRHKDAQRCLAKAYELLRDTPFSLEAASARLGISTSALYVDLPSRSLALAQQASDEMFEIGANAYANHARINIGHCHAMMGRADEAVRIFSELRANSEPNSLEFTRLGQFLGDAWLDLQVYDAAGDAFESALNSPGIRQSQLNHGYILVGLGDVRLHQGRGKEAKEFYHRASKIHQKIGNFPANNLSQIGLARAEISLGRIGPAKKILEKSITDLRSRRMFHFLVGALLDLAEIQSKNEDLLSEASKIIRKFGFIGDAWRIHSIRAKSSITNSGAIREYRKMLETILNHRARLSSITARTSLIEPCLISIRTYLTILIEKKSSAATKEALQVISDLRSITLLDEFLLAGGESMSDSAQSILNRIRQEVTADGGDQLPGGPLRLIANGLWSKPALVREYLEQIGLSRIDGLNQKNLSENQTPVNTFIFLQNGSAWLSEKKTQNFSITREELITRLRWIHFELMAPLSGFLSDDIRLDREIKRLRADLGVESLESVGNNLHVSVEDVAYQIPWALLTNKEAVLHLRPRASICPSRTFLGNDPKIGIWYFSRKELPHIDREVAQIRNMFPQAKIYSTVDEILKSADQESFDLIHVAAHGRYDHENPMFSSIQLADGHLLACDIARSAFRTRIATLASCDSASMGQPTGWEPQGLARAFLARRSEVVIGSLWPLSDIAAEFGFSTFYRKLKVGRSVSDSLSDARSDLKEKFSHPAYWASLVMFGGYTS